MIKYRAHLKTAVCLSLLAFILVSCSSPNDEKEEEEIVDQYLRVPTQFATIQAAINAAETDDTVLVADGVYKGFGNRDLKINGKSIAVISENGPIYTVIDCEGSEMDQHFGVEYQTGANGSILEGFTIKNGYFNHGSAIHCNRAAPIVKNCLLYDNYASTSGGAVRCKSASPDFYNCTIVGNSSIVGGGFFLIAGAAPKLYNCIIAYSGEGGAFYSSDGTSIPELYCCNLFGNEGGDWNERIIDQADINGNQNIKPMFCDSLLKDFRLQVDSPSAATDSVCILPRGILVAECD